MFKCFDIEGQREIIILDSHGKGDQLAHLRAKSRSKSLFCPECKQPVLVKAGDIKTWHFAHQDLGSCPLQSESPAVLNARRLLYAWLLRKFVKIEGLNTNQQASVTVEKKMSENLPRPVDCFVEFPDGKQLAYWIFERGIRNRHSLTYGLENTILNTVFLKEMLRPAPNEAGALDLTPTERDFLAESQYNIVHRGSGKSLHYFDNETATLTTLRGVTLLHNPQRYRSGAVWVHPLSEILTNRKGEFIHPGEHAGLEDFRRLERAIQNAIPDIREKAARRWHSSPESCPPSPTVSEPTHDWPEKSKPADSESSMRLIRLINKEIPMTCTGCGKQTSDWISCRPSEETCLCRVCLDRQYKQN